MVQKEMEDENRASQTKPDQEKGRESKGESLTQQPPEAPLPSSAGGWGDWGFSPFSVLSDLQKAAKVAAEEFSRNATVVAEQAKKIADLQVDEDSESSNVEKEAEESQTDDEKDKLRKSALEKLEKASEDSVLGQRLLALDSSVENFASGAWSALGNALRGGTNLVQKLENSAVNLADSIEEGGLPATSRAPASFMETGKAFTSKGMQVLEYVRKETMDLLISETGMEVEKNSKDNEEQLCEEATFDRCFYIYGGPEQLEELEALSNHYAMLFNRRKAKLPQEQRTYEGQLKQIQQIFSLSTEMDGTGAESNKGKKSETGTEGSEDEMKSLHDSSVRKAADMAAGFTNALAGLALNDVNQRTTERLESINSEGVHRLSELCCFAVSQLLMLGKSIKSHANKCQEGNADEDMANVVWPEDSLEKAKIIRIKAQPMAGYLEAVSNSFITGISDVAGAYQAAIKGATAADSPEALPPASIQEKANALSEHIRSDKTTAMSKIQDGLQCLSYVILATSMPAA